MDSDSYEARLREGEYFHGLRLLPGAWAVIRVDGRGFSRFTERRFDKPFDARFRDLMTQSAQAVMVEMGGLYAYTESDEISILFRPEWDLFDRELEKLVSISAGIASATFTLACSDAVCFDSRIWLGVSGERVVDYFRWRQSDAARCSLNGWCYWTLRKEGRSVSEATAMLEHLSVADKNELLFQRGLNFNDVPLWQRRGVGLYRVAFEKTGYDPIRQQSVTVTRQGVKVDYELPMKEAYDAFLLALLNRAE